ncbi:hypothetical protein ILUMI_22796 [Ignelater luminosus]|uniref:Uncharacterized protein n=1 Tax=Ignelater luminosus TaxID=2038154 RepID=A0A8K0CF46_IGNLU|nr:hypothetical protein ILUMI_22796 [Ignelater luminosus]
MRTCWFTNPEKLKKERTDADKYVPVQGASLQSWLLILTEFDGPKRNWVLYDVTVFNRTPIVTLWLASSLRAQRYPDAVLVPDTDIQFINIILEENEQININEGQNLDCISSITTDEIQLVSENTTPVGVWCEYVVNFFLLPIPGKTETFGVAEIAMKYKNNKTDLEGTPDMTNKEMEVVEDSSVINVERESSKSHLESTGYGDITKHSSTTNNTDSSISVCERRVLRISKKRLKAKKRKVSGLAYTGYKKAQSGIVVQNCNKVARSLKQRCIYTSTVKKSEKSFLCGLFSEEEREAVFKKFWNFSSWLEKRAFVQGLVNTRKIRKRIKKLEQKQSKKNEGHDIFLPRRDGEKLRVCRLLFINTLSLGEDTFKRWVKTDKEDGFTSSDGSERNSNDEDNSQPPAKIPRRQSKMKGIKQKVHNEMTENVLEWLELLPKVPSHYCRSSSSCTYVESVFRSISHMRKQLFLEKGHTMMECDSVHAISEKYFIPPINAPSDYIAQMRNAQQKQPYHIKVVDYTFFKNFESIPFNIHFLRPGKKAGEPVVTDIRALAYRNNGEILFKLRHTGAFEFLPQRQQKRTGHVVPELLYSRPIPIAESK